MTKQVTSGLISPDSPGIYILLLHCIVYLYHELNSASSLHCIVRRKRNNRKEGVTKQVMSRLTSPDSPRIYIPYY